MTESKWMNGFYTGAIWVTKFCYIHILWIVFSILGCVVFGIFPATNALCVTIRKWLMGYDDVPVSQTFWQAYKKNFARSNIIGYITLLLGVILYVDIRFVLLLEADWAVYLLPPLVLLTVLYILLSIYIFPVHVHYDATILQIFRNAFVFIFSHPSAHLKSLFGLLAVYYILHFIPGLIPFFSISMIGFVCMWSMFDTLQKKTTSQHSESP